VDEYVEIYVGMGAKKIPSTISECKERSPEYKFIDEIDSAGKVRGSVRQ